MQNVFLPFETSILEDFFFIQLKPKSAVIHGRKTGTAHLGKRNCEYSPCCIHSFFFWTSMEKKKRTMLELKWKHAFRKFFLKFFKTFCIQKVCISTDLGFLFLFSEKNLFHFFFTIANLFFSCNNLLWNGVAWKKKGLQWWTKIFFCSFN